MGRFWGPVSVRLFSVFTAILVLASCGRTEDSGFASRPAVKAQALVGDSFYNDLKQGYPRLAIQKSALDKEFLLQGALIPQGTATTGQGIKSRVVVFVREAEKVFMLEATQGHVITTDLPTQLVLASFPILNENDSSITFDFNEGMTSIFTADEWYASDNDGTQYNSTFGTKAIRHSRILSIAVNEKNELAIRQVGQLTASDSKSVEIRYYLSPYRPDPGYTPVKGGKFKKTGFFEVQPQLTANGSPKIYSSKHSIAKPIVFAISANTPVEYREAVRDGILYWNRALGKELVQVVDAPVGVTAPDINFNVVQWVNHDTAGFAYADAQMDPRTGQILHAQVYLTSAFAFLGKSRARMLLRRLHDAKTAKNTRVRLEGLSEASMCDFHAKEAFTEGLKAVIAEDVSDEAVLRVSQDYVRAVTAHEIGHTLGLRHNFAGSLYTENYSAKERPEVFKKYLTEDVIADNVVMGSSVMEYPTFEEDTMWGYFIRKGRPVLKYDGLALKVLYEGANPAELDLPPFCTDSHRSSYADCKTFDIGKSPIEAATAAGEDKKRKVSFDLLEKFIAARSPVAGVEPSNIEEVGLEAGEIATTLFEPRSTMLTAFGSSTRLLVVAREFPYIGPSNLEKVKAREWQFLLGEIDRMGGIDKVFAMFPSDYPKQVRDAFFTVVENPKYLKGQGASGNTFELTAKEVDFMKASVEELAAQLPAKIAKEDVETLGYIPAVWKSTSNEIGDALVTTLSKRIDNYVFAQNGELLVAEIEIPADKKEDPKIKRKVMLPKFSYVQETRKKAAGLLSAPSGDENKDWGLREREVHKAKLAAVLNAAVGSDITKISAGDVKVISGEGDLKKLQRAVTIWFLDNKAVLDEIK